MQPPIDGIPLAGVGWIVVGPSCLIARYARSENEALAYAEMWARQHPDTVYRVCRIEHSFRAQRNGPVTQRRRAA